MTGSAPPPRPNALSQLALSAMSYREKKAENDKRLARNTKRAMIKAFRANDPQAVIPSMFLEPGFTGMSEDEDEIDVAGHIRRDSTSSLEEQLQRDRDMEDEANLLLEEQRLLEEEEQRRLAEDLLKDAGGGGQHDDANPGPMSPASVKRAIANAIASVMGGVLGIGSKRSSSAKSADGSSLKKKARTDRVEADLAIGEVSRPAVPDDYGLMWDAREHLSLSLFTLPALRLVHVKGNSLRTIKNTYDRGGPKLINTDDPRFAREESLDYATWSGAIGTFLDFTRDLDKKGTAYNWYFQHFKFCTDLVTTLTEDWETVRSFDIATRQEYHMSAFKFGHDTHHSRFLAHERLFQRMKEQRPSSSASARQSGPSRREYPPAGSANPLHRQPFQARQPGIRSPSVCLICGNPGHRSDSCRVQKLRGTDKPVFSKFANGKLVSARDANPICAPWNVTGTFGTRCTQHNRAEHACSFCGKLDHHATSWVCLPNASTA